MAQYIFIKTRQSVNSASALQQLEQVCSLLTPTVIKNKSQNTIEVWSQDPNAFYAIQNSEGVTKPAQGELIIGWWQPTGNDYLNGQQSASQHPELCSPEADGSYAVIKNIKKEVSFFSDQFGSRTLWYYCDESTLIVSTSQRAVVALKGSFSLNKEALAWYLSSGCQGPFIAWDQEVKQVLPHLEYRLKISDWRVHSKLKLGMNLPLSGSTKMDDYLELYQRQVTTSLDQIINSYSKNQVLLPLSGGLDSRLLLALSKNAHLNNKVTLVNWGVPNPEDVFDDKVAARRVAKFYGMALLDKSLPTKIDDYDEVLDCFVEASEGRIDHFNAFVDGFKMWDEFFQHGYRMIIRGDIPFPTGLCLNELQMRTKMGLELFSDYANISDFNVEEYAKLQHEYSSKRLEGESLIRWRDRTFTCIRVPMILAAFSHQISSFTENRTPMLNWTLFKLYMGLSDKDKGEKQHIRILWKRHDHSSVPAEATDSLRSMNSYFDNEIGLQYLLHELVDIKKSPHFSLDLVNSVYDLFLKQQQHTAATSIAIVKGTVASQKVRGWLSNNLPPIPKAYLKSRQVKRLSAVTLAYRLVLAEKIITMYESDAKLGRASDVY